MKNFVVFGYTLNWLEFVTYIIIPSSIILVILVYIFFNIRLIRLTMESNIEFLDDIESQCNDKLKSINFEALEEDFFIEKAKEKVK